MSVSVCWTVEKPIRMLIGRSGGRLFALLIGHDQSICYAVDRFIADISTCSSWWTRSGSRSRGGVWPATNLFLGRDNLF